MILKLLILWYGIFGLDISVCMLFCGNRIVLLVLSCIVLFDVLCSSMGLCMMKWNCVWFGVWLKFSLNGCVIWMWWYWMLFRCIFSSSLLMRLCVLGIGGRRGLDILRYGCLINKNGLYVIDCFVVVFYDMCLLVFFLIDMEFCMNFGIFLVVLMVVFCELVWGVVFVMVFGVFGFVMVEFLLVSLFMLMVESFGVIEGVVG